MALLGTGALIEGRVIYHGIVLTGLSVRIAGLLLIIFAIIMIKDIVNEDNDEKVD